MTFIHAYPPRISCNEHGIIEAVMPWTERKSRFTLRFETRSIRILQNMDTSNFSDITRLSWNQAWNILERAVRRGRERKKRSLDEYYNTLTKEDLSRKETVSMDIWDPFMSSTMEHVPDASFKIVFYVSHGMSNGMYPIQHSKWRE